MVLFLVMPIFTVYKKYKNIIKMVSLPYGTILIFTAYGPILRRLMSPEEMNLMSSFFLFVLVLSMIAKPGLLCRRSRQRLCLTGLIVISGVSLLPFAYYPYWLQWAAVGLLAFTEGRIASIWSRLFLSSVASDERGTVIGVTLFVSYGFLYLTNMAFLELPATLLTPIASVLLFLSIPSQYKLMMETEVLKPWKDESRRIGSKSILAIFFIIYISAGATYSGIFPELVNFGRYYQFINVLPFVLAVPFIGRLADLKGRYLLLFLGMGSLGLSYIVYLFPQNPLQYILTEISLEVGWAFLDAAVWIIGADLAVKYRNSRIQMFCVGAFLSGTFMGSLIYVGLMKFWGEQLFIILMMAHIPLFLGLLIMGIIINGRKLDIHKADPADKVPVHPLSTLTAREREIFMILKENHSNKEICYTLKISPNTLKTHIRSIYKKTGVTSRGEFLMKYLPEISSDFPG